MPALFAKLIGDEPGYCGRIRLVCGADPGCSSCDLREQVIEGMLNHHGIRCQLRDRLRLMLGARIRVVSRPTSFVKLPGRSMV